MFAWIVDKKYVISSDKQGLYHVTINGKDIYQTCSLDIALHIVKSFKEKD
jgi:hypothetical protein